MLGRAWKRPGEDPNGSREGRSSRRKESKAGSLERRIDGGKELGAAAMVEGKNGG